LFSNEDVDHSFLGCDVV